MGLNKYDFIVVSAFGRGHWLAAELAAQKTQVLLLDMTSKLGVWPPEDGEGPFGVFRLEKFADSFLECLTHGDPIENLENGFCAWLSSGPLEFKGPLSRFHWERLRLPLEWLDDLGKGQERSPGEHSFLKTWPWALARQLASTHYTPSAEAVSKGRALPLAAPFGIRIATRQGHGQSLDWLRSRGVEVSDSTDILDLAMSVRNRLDGVELKGGKTGLVRFDDLVWTLTGGETRFLSEKLSQRLFPQGVVNPSWSWIRYRLKVDEHPTLDRLPLHVVVIEDLESPWTHGNFVILQKTDSEASLDAWMRIPAVQRFNKGYLEEHGDRLIRLVRSRLPDVNAVIQMMPQEAVYTSQEVGPPRFPVWTDGLNPSKTRLSSTNVHFESPENRQSHSVDEAYDHQLVLRDRLVKAWHLKQEKLSKEKSL